MNWESFDAFLAMGGYGFYVWGSYAVTFALIAMEVVLLRLRGREIMNQLIRAERPRRSAP
ncbi:MAG: heme exporter protein CcmD [Betaproteobacteria bacterium]|nr:heme exporter protein CcmD [Betaproteobacteria bacterium]